MTRKINHKILFLKTLLYRSIVVGVQAVFTYLYLSYFTIMDFYGAINISLLWNFINCILYYLYEYLFSLRYDTTIQTKGCVVWFTGLPCSGKSTVADYISEELKRKGKSVERLDGDIVRNGLCKDLTFSPEDRRANLERICFVSKLLSRNNTVVLCSFVSPYNKDREELKKQVGENFILVHVSCPAKECAIRDVKGMWNKARMGLIKGFTGFDSPYEPPSNPDLTLFTDVESVEESSTKVLKYLQTRGLI